MTLLSGVLSGADEGMRYEVWKLSGFGQEEPKLLGHLNIVMEYQGQPSYFVGTDSFPWRVSEVRKGLNARFNLGVYNVSQRSISGDIVGSHWLKMLFWHVLAYGSRDIYVVRPPLTLLGRTKTAAIYAVPGLMHFGQVVQITVPAKVVEPRWVLEYGKLIRWNERYRGELQVALDRALEQGLA